MNTLIPQMFETSDNSQSKKIKGKVVILKSQFLFG